jgi:hypothetical protein
MASRVGLRLDFEVGREKLMDRGRAPDRSIQAVSLSNSDSVSFPRDDEYMRDQRSWVESATLLQYKHICTTSKAALVSSELGLWPSGRQARKTCDNNSGGKRFTGARRLDCAAQYHLSLPRSFNKFRSCSRIRASSTST